MAEDKDLDPRKTLEKLLLQRFHLLLSDEEAIEVEEIGKLVGLIKERRVTTENILAVLQNGGELEDERENC
jgi:hypothetical protein